MRRPSALDQLFQFGQRPRIDDVAGLEPAPAGLIDTKAHKVELSGGVSICRDREFDPHGFRRLRMNVR